MFEELATILSNRLLKAHFMPIVSTEQQRILGYEALIRGPAGSHLHSPLNLFNAAQKSGRLLELELLCREAALRRFKALELPGRLFLNITPGALLEPDFESGRTLQLLEEIGLRPRQVVIEITEHYPIDDYQLMRAATRHYQQAGFAVAIDDLGAGHASLRSWAELKPEYVKIDRHFIDGVDRDLTKQEFVRSIAEIARGIGCQVIAEGVETLPESDALHALGLAQQQGYHFSRPTETPPRLLPLRLFPGRKDHKRALPAGRRPLYSLVRETPFLPSDTPLSGALQLFRADPQLHHIPVVDHGRPRGLLARGECLELVSSRYGEELFGHKPVSQLIRTEPLLLEQRLSLQEASLWLAAQNRPHISTFIVTDQGRYQGLGSLVDLLRTLAEPDRPVADAEERGVPRIAPQVA